MRTENEAVVRLLLEKGAQPDLRIGPGVFRGMSPRPCALERGLKLVQELFPEIDIQGIWLESCQG